MAVWLIGWRPPLPHSFWCCSTHCWLYYLCNLSSFIHRDVTGEKAAGKNEKFANPLRLTLEWTPIVKRQQHQLIDFIYSHYKSYSRKMEKHEQMLNFSTWMYKSAMTQVTTKIIVYKKMKSALVKRKIVVLESCKLP